MVAYDALTQALKSGHLSWAALETFAIEPVPAVGGDQHNVIRTVSDHSVSYPQALK